MIIKSEKILTESGFVDGYLTTEEGTILSILDRREKDRLPAGKILDYGNLRIIPGLIDIHNHGYGGWSMTDPATPDDVKGFVKAVSSIGVTTVLPTAKEEAFEAIADCVETGCQGARIFGIHSEGPFWARGGENTVDAEYPLPDLVETRRLVAKCRGKMVMMAIAPELPKAYDVIRYLHDQGIKVAAAHTKARAQEIKDAMEEAGLDIVTHLCNGMTGIHHRDVGALGAFLLEDRLYYELIADLNHVCADMIRLIFRLQPYEKFIMISDSNFIAGLPIGKYTRYGKVMNVNENGLIKDIHGRICGSGKYVLYNMQQLVEKLDVPLEDVSKMCSLNPARFLGIEKHTGSIAPGKRCDITIIDDCYRCVATYLDGEKIYDRNIDTDIFKKESLALRIDD